MNGEGGLLGHPLVHRWEMLILRPVQEIENDVQSDDSL